MTELQLKKLRILLPRGAQKTISEQLEITKAHVSNVLNGSKTNARVISLAIKLAEIEVMRQRKESEIIENLV